MPRALMTFAALILVIAAFAPSLRAGPAIPAEDRALADPAARARAMAAAAPLFARHCARCHGADGAGSAARHAPSLIDDRWIFGGEDIDTFLIRPSDIARTIRHGIRAHDPQTRNLALMPARGTGHSLDPDEIAAVTEYVLKLSGQPYDERQIPAGKEAYEGEGGCYDCHMAEGWGDPAIGSADLTRPETWLYGHDRAHVLATVAQGRAGQCPALGKVLTPAQIRDLAVYVVAKAKSRKFI